LDGSGPAERRRDIALADVRVDALLRQLDELTPLPSAGILSAPKRIAALALYIKSVCGLETDMALQAATGGLASHLGSTPGGLKKAVSEARAIMQFGLPSQGFESPAPESAAHLLQEITTRLQSVNVREVTQARAQALGGVRGGRRHGPRGRQALAAVQSLLERVQLGSADALAELLEIQALIQAARPLGGHTEDRPEATPRS